MPQVANILCSNTKFSSKSCEFGGIGGADGEGRGKFYVP